MREKMEEERAIYFRLFLFVFVKSLAKKEEKKKRRLRCFNITPPPGWLHCEFCCVYVVSTITLSEEGFYTQIRPKSNEFQRYRCSSSSTERRFFL